MNKLITIICCAFTLTACDQPNAPAEARNTPNGDIRVIKGFQIMSDDVSTAAIRACDKENKKLEVISTSTQPSIMSDRQYPVIMFRCL